MISPPNLLLLLLLSRLSNVFSSADEMEIACWMYALKTSEERDPEPEDMHSDEPCVVQRSERQGRGAMRYLLPAIEPEFHREVHDGDLGDEVGGVSIFSIFSGANQQ